MEGTRKSERKQIKPDRLTYSKDHIPDKKRTRKNKRVDVNKFKNLKEREEETKEEGELQETKEGDEEDEPKMMRRTSRKNGSKQKLTRHKPNIVTHFSFYPTTYTNTNGSYLGNVEINTVGEGLPNGMDKVDFELTNLMKHLRNISSANPKEGEELNKITPVIKSSYSAANIALVQPKINEGNGDKDSGDKDEDEEEEEDEEEDDEDDEEEEEEEEEDDEDDEEEEDGDKKKKEEKRIEDEKNRIEGIEDEKKKKEARETIHIEGATDVYADIINGLYEMTEWNSGNMPIFKKQGDNILLQHINIGKYPYLFICPENNPHLKYAFIVCGKNDTRPYKISGNNNWVELDKSGDYHANIKIKVTLEPNPVKGGYRSAKQRSKKPYNMRKRSKRTRKTRKYRRRRRQ